MKIPKSFKTMYQTDDIIEFKSRYHYWYAFRIQDTDRYILYHKHHYHDQYHRQFEEIHTLKFIVKYVFRHDAHLESFRATRRLSQQQTPLSPDM